MSKFPFNFPFDPYDIQILFMEQLCDVLDNDKIGIFASPTGTGKSMSLLCGTLHWLMEYRKKLSIPLAEATNDENLKAQLENEPDWVKQFAMKQKAQLELDRIKGQAENAVHLHKIRKNSTKSLAEIRKRAGYVSSSDSEDDKIIRDKRSVQPLQIFYASRTHSQLSQFVSELRRTVYGSMFNIRSVSLGSRKQLCINKAVNSLASMNLINERCQELRQSGPNRCKFYNPDSDELNEFLDAAFNEVSDIEDMLKHGERTCQCPYYGARSALPYAEIVAIPYSILLNAHTRESLNIRLDNSIIIIDEAHNLIDAITQVHSIWICKELFNEAAECLTSYISKYSSRLSGDNLVLLKQIVAFLKKIDRFMAGVKSAEIYQVLEFMTAARVENFNLFTLIAYMKDSEICRKSRSHVKKSETGKIPISPLYQVLSLFEMLAFQDKNGRILTDIVEDRVSLKYLLLNSAEPFQDIVDSCKSLILAGGTMEPLDEIFCHLLPSVPLNRISTFSCDHVIPADNLATLVIPSGVNGVKFEFNFESRSNASMLMELGESIVRICGIVPSGVVIFFPSFEYLNDSVSCWKRSTIYNEVDILKRVFVEPRDAKNVAAVLEKYESIIKAEKGAILFSVVGGKLSEGINFSDNMARGVIVIGMPYPNMKSPELSKKMEYLDQIYKQYQNDPDLNTVKPISSRDYYENLCMKAVNQSIGRAIRHKNDYAVVMLLDCRYARDGVRKKLPGWMRHSISCTSGFAEASDRVKRFFQKIR